MRSLLYVFVVVVLIVMTWISVILFVTYTDNLDTVQFRDFKTNQDNLPLLTTNDTSHQQLPYRITFLVPHMDNGMRDIQHLEQMHRFGDISLFTITQETIVTGNQEFDRIMSSAENVFGYNDYVRSRPAKVKQVQQYMDYLRILQIAADRIKCYEEKDYVMLLEDDNQLCEGSAELFDHLLRAVLDHKEFKHKWNLIRVSLGGSGLILRCDMLQSLVKFMEDTVDINKTHMRISGYMAVDFTIPQWGIEHKLQSYVLSLNLFLHTGTTSGIWGKMHQDARIIPKCMSGIAMKYHKICIGCMTNYSCAEKGFLFSPCEELENSVFKHPMVEANFGIKGNELMKQYEIGNIVVGDSNNCTAACALEGLKAQDNIYLEHSCDILRKAFGCKECHYISNPCAPGLHENDLCYVPYPQTPFVSSISCADFNRLCACQSSS